MVLAILMERSLSQHVLVLHDDMGSSDKVTINSMCSFVQVPGQSPDMNQRVKDPFLVLTAEHAEEDTVV